MTCKNDCGEKMSEVNKDIGARVKELRDLSDITTEEIANELGIDEKDWCIISILAHLVWRKRQY